MKIDKFIVKEILEIGFDGIFFLEIIVLMQFDFKRQIFLVIMNEVIELIGFLGGVKREIYYFKFNCFMIMVVIFDYFYI